jgi:hypothetical protein
MADESYFRVDGNEWQEKSYYESEDRPATENVKFIHKTISCQRRFWKVYSNNYRSKDVKCLMAKIRKELMSIETTGIRKAIIEVLEKAQKAHRLGVTFFASNLCM